MAGNLSEQELMWRLDLMAFMEGHHPTKAEMKAAPLLSAWKAVVRWRSPGSAGFAVRIAGFVRNHPNFIAEKAITTSPIVWIDASLSWARSERRLYRLAAPFKEMADEDVEPDYGD
jgi:hypothetical protein